MMTVYLKPFILFALVTLWGSFVTPSEIFNFRDSVQFPAEIRSLSVEPVSSLLEKRCRHGDSVDSGVSLATLKKREISHFLISSIGSKRKRHQEDLVPDLVKQISIEGEIDSLLKEHKICPSSFHFTPVSLGKIGEEGEIDSDSNGKVSLIKGASTEELDGGEFYDYSRFLEMGRKLKEQELVEEGHLKSVQVVAEIMKAGEVEKESDDEDEAEKKDVEKVLFKTEKDERSPGYSNSPSSLAAAACFSLQNFDHITPTSPGVLLPCPSPVRNFAAFGMTRSAASGNLSALKRTDSADSDDSFALKFQDEREKEGTHISENDDYDNELTAVFSNFGLFVDVEDHQFKLK